MNDNYIKCETRDIFNSLDLIDSFDFCYQLLDKIINSQCYIEIENDLEHLDYFVRMRNIMKNILQENKYNKKEEEIEIL